MTSTTIVDFIDYYEDNFKERLTHNNRRRQPRYAVSMWNGYSRLDQQLPKSNNASKGWHRAIQVYEFMK